MLFRGGNSLYWDQLHYFALTYHLGSFSAAAKRVPMSSQGLAKAVCLLESELGVPLFVADPSGKLHATPQADLLLDFANDCERGYAKLQGEFAALRARENHELNVGIGLGILGYLGPDFIKRFQRKHPGVVVRYEELSDRSCDEGLRCGRLDIALTVAPYAPDFIVTELYSTPMCFWVSANDPLAQRESLSIEDFQDRRVALPGEDFKCFATLRNMARDAGVRLGEVHATAEIFRMFDFAREGKGLGFSAKHLAEMPLFEKDPTVVAIPLGTVTWRFGIAQLSSRKPTPEMEAFRDFCIASI